MKKSLLVTPIFAFLVVLTGLAQEEALEKNPAEQMQQANDQLNQAISLLRERDFEAALGRFEQAVGLMRSIPEQEEGPVEQYNRAAMAFRAGKHDEAAELVAPVLEAEEERLRSAAVSLAASVYLNQRDLRAIYTLAEKLLEKEEAEERAADLIHQACEQLDQWRSCLRWLDDQGLGRGEAEDPFTLVRAAALDATGDLEKGQALLRSLVDHDPSNSRYVSQLFTSLKRVPDTVEGELEELHNKYPDSAPIRDRFALVLQSNEKYAEALPLLEVAAEEDSADPNRRYQLAEAAMECGEIETALRAYRYLLGQVKEPATQAKACFAYGKALIKAEDYKGALEQFRNFDRLLKSMPSSSSMKRDQPALSYWLGCAYHGMRDWERAEEEFRKFQRTMPFPDAEISVPLAEIYAQRGHWPEAVQALSTALQDPRFPNDLDMLLKLGEAQLNAKDYRQALGTVEKIRSLSGGGKRDMELEQEKRFALLRARTEESAGERTVAISIARRARDRFPDDPDITELLAGLLLQADEDVEEKARAALEMLNEAQIESEPPGWQMLRARAQLRLGSVEEAEELFQGVAAEDDQLAAEAYEGLAEISMGRARELLESGDPQNARKEALKAMATLEQIRAFIPFSTDQAERQAEARALVARIEGVLESEKIASIRSRWRNWLYGASGLILALIVAMVAILRRPKDYWVVMWEQVNSIEMALRSFVKQAAERRLARGYSLTVLSEAEQGQLPTQGTKKVILVGSKSRAHVRIFDGQGAMVADQAMPIPKDVQSGLQLKEKGSDNGEVDVEIVSKIMSLAGLSEWEEYVLKKHSETRGKTAKEAKQRYEEFKAAGNSISENGYLDQTYLSDLIALLAIKELKDETEAFLTDSVRSLILQELNFVASCRNAIAHFRTLDDSLRNRFLRTARPLLDDLLRAHAALEGKKVRKRAPTQAI